MTEDAQPQQPGQAPASSSVVTFPTDPVALVRTFWLPTLVGIAAILVFVDPTVRYAVLVATLPFLQRGSLNLMGLEVPPTLRARTPWSFHVASFTFLVVGWTVMFTIVVMAIAAGVFGVYFSFDSMKRSILGGCLMFVVAAWFWWPFYASALLEAWPRHDKRVFVKASNRWDTMLEARRLQRQSRRKWPGFVAVAVIAGTVIASSATGAWEGIFPTVLGIIGVIALVPLNWLAVSETNGLCVREERGGDAEQAGEEA
tara:strand:+ start:6290 stop:7060 length:771 start_codon:yes stop_codon:yes gene_type:complete